VREAVCVSLEHPFHCRIQRNHTLTVISLGCQDVWLLSKCTELGGNVFWIGGRQADRTATKFVDWTALFNSKLICLLLTVDNSLRHSWRHSALLNGARDPRGDQRNAAGARLTGQREGPRALEVHSWLDGVCAGPVPPCCPWSALRAKKGCVCQDVGITLERRRSTGPRLLAAARWTAVPARRSGRLGVFWGVVFLWLLRNTTSLTFTLTLGGGTVDAATRMVEAGGSVVNTISTAACSVQTSLSPAPTHTAPQRGWATQPSPALLEQRRAACL